jgi:hypothetical protein
MWNAASLVHEEDALRSGNIPTTSPRADRSCALGVTAIIRSPEPGQKIEIALYGYKLPK